MESKDLTRTVSASKIVQANASEVWELLRHFGTWNKWCPLFEYMHIIGDGKDVIGAVREFKSKGTNTVYQEKLRKRDDSNYFIAFDNHSMVPPIEGLGWITTTVYLTRKDEENTEVNYSHTTTLDKPNDQLFNIIQTGQKKSMEIMFQSIIGHLTISHLVEKVFHSLYSKLVQIQKDLAIGRSSEKWEYADYPEKYGPLPRMIKGLPPTQALSPRTIGKMIQRLTEILYFRAAYPEKKPDEAILEITKIQKDEELEYLEKHLLQNYHTDVEFCQQLLQGVNPMCIEVVKNYEQIPPKMRNLKAQGKYVEELLKENRLFILDYKELRNLKHHLNMYFCAPVMLVYKELLPNNESRLNVLGIQLSLDSDTVYTPDMEHKFRYQLAKLFVASADHQVHEFKWHLGLSHLGIEAIAVSVHNCLSENTPIRALLQPHFKDTIGINYMARQTLVAKELPFTDHTFAIGTEQALRVVSEAWQGWDFFKSSFPEQLRARGFDEKKSDGLEHYYYREDGFLLWNAIGEYTKDFVEHTYKNDQGVAENADIKKWAEEVANVAKVPGFPSKIETMELLAHVLQIIIWNASAFHSLVNFPQWTYLGFMPNRPNALYKEMPPEDGNDITPQYIQECLPDKYLALFQIAFSWILSTPSDDVLADINSLESIYPNGNKRFHKLLDDMTEKITARNQKLKEAGKAPYIFCLPKYIAMSVNI